VISRVASAFLLTAIAILLAGPAHGDTINSLVGVNFQPYIGAWSGNPPAPPLFNSYTYTDVLADLQTVKARGFGSIKTYGVGTSPFSGNGDNLDSNQYNVKAANALGLGVYLGANLQFANGGLDVARTKMEIDLAIKQAADFPGTVKTLIIGNESIGVNGVTVADMVSLMDYAKAQRTAAGFTAATLPVTTVQQWGVLAGPANQALSQAAEGSIYANIYPFFDANTSIGNAISQFHTDYDALRTALNSFGLGSLPIAIGETGWATAGTNTTNSLGTPNTANALKYFNDYVAQVTVSTFFFEAFDEPWKANPQTNPQSVEPHFGLPKSGLVGSPPPVPAPTPSSLLMAVLGMGTLAVARFGVSRRGERSAH
jgi:exo-beta-1,3-glucanase (GH17 family)